MTRVVVIGVLLGVASRFEETTRDFHVGVSTNATWLGVAFLVGVLRARRDPVRVAAAGSIALTVANVAYYAWIGLTEPGVALAGVAGPPAVWFLLGVGGGAVFAVTARAWVSSRGAARVAASLPLAGVCIADGVDRGGDPSGVLTAAFGCAVAIVSARQQHQRLIAGLVSAAIVVCAAGGLLDPFLP